MSDFTEYKDLASRLGAAAAQNEMNVESLCVQLERLLDGECKHGSSPDCCSVCTGPTREELRRKTIELRTQLLAMKTKYADTVGREFTEIVFQNEQLTRERDEARRAAIRFMDDPSPSDGMYHMVNSWRKGRK